MGDVSCKICDAAKQWLKQPYNDNMSVFDWFLFVGLIGAISFLWSRVLARI